MLVLALLCTLTILILVFTGSRSKSKEINSLKERLSSISKEFQEKDKAYTTSQNELGFLKIENEKLSPFKAILDIEKHLAERKRQVDEDIATSQDRHNVKIKNEQTEIFLKVSKAQEEASAVVAKAKENAKLIDQRANQVLMDANKNAKITIDKAIEDAKSIAADAYDAKNKSDLFEKTALAMKNIIEGYGDRYIVPTHGLLDQLSDEYSHTQGGEELKRARERTRSMIKNHTAADCEYVEDNRRTTAINFVLDAFNGKVDTILSGVKENNYGTLEQKIKDSFQTVNYNGRAFREAKITDLYLAARLDELKWACTVQAIKERDKEEQRRIREQIREEEKAARDYEKALKETQKEEENLAKAMAKVQKDLESANEQQRLQYEAKLRELEQKLRETEEKNRRALSMAQQTKTGHVYIISNIGSFGDDVIKIGLTRRLDPQDRIDELGDASVPFDFDVHAMILSEDAPALEKELHRRFSIQQINKVNPRKEFFKISIGDLRTEIEHMGIKAHWTMAAEAKEFKESISLARNSNGNSAA